ncbi:Ig-like domain repeat protein [uncultured Methanobrevibacter sp.]|uniref:Ig-like domain repeat protein n=1 Tax=uncultured Methanobrevibacter sp. TaxID=253161 RepID=UPI0025E8025B|nr:Ig-like domain repeat protein [uncultured Methanobrevibacter sp.]
MKFNKLVLVSVVLLIILSIGAVSAQNDDALSASNSADVLSAGSFDKTIYVSDTGDDSGSGSQASPYATLYRSLSDVNSSDNAAIYVGPGTFTGENNTNLQINLAHKNYNGSLTIIGDSNGGTIFDGDDSASIIKSISADSIVTLINITFAHGKTDMGSAIRSAGDLTIDGCVFTENEATNLAAIYPEKGSLTIMNSKFINNTGRQAVDIYSSISDMELILLNNLFEGSTATYSYSYAPSVSMQSGKSIIKGNTFKDMSGSYYAGALHVAYNNGDNIANITDNTFVNCTYTGSNGGIIFFQNAYLKNNRFINCTSSNALLYSNTNFNAFLTFEDVEVDGTSFTLKVNVTDDVGNKVKGAGVTFYLDGKNVGSATSNNDGVASLNVNKLLDNGEYPISGTQEYSSSTPNIFEVTVKNGTATVDFDHSPLEVWVSTDGNDTTGDGSEANPFLTLKKALDYGTAATVDLTVRVKNGYYNGDGNIDLDYSNVGKIAVIGESYGNVIIDAEHKKSGWSGADIFYFGKNLEITLVNLTLINCDGSPVNAYTLTMKDNVVVNSSTIRAQSPNDGVKIDNLRVINGTSQAINAYNLELTNSLFENCNGGTSTGLLWLATNGDNVLYLENNTFVRNTIAGYSGGAAYYAQGDLISINNTFDSNTVTGSASNIAYASGDYITSINDKFINNNVTSYVAQYRSSGSNPTEIIVENITFINNTASANGAGLATTGAKIKGAKFINNTAAGNGGAIYILNHGSSNKACETSLEDVVFENNKATSGNDIFILSPTSTSMKAGDVEGINVIFIDKNISDLSDSLSATVTHDSGAIIGGGSIDFYMDGVYVGTGDIINGEATIQYFGFKNGTHSLGGVWDNEFTNDTNYVNGTLIVELKPMLDNITLYVSDSRGDDENGNGSYDNPFKTIETAINKGTALSPVVVVNVLEGTYAGEGNVNLRVPTGIDITILGEGQDKTIIADNSSEYFVTALLGNGILKIANLTIKEAGKAQKSMVYIERGAIVEMDNVALLEGSGNYGGAINNGGTLTVKDSYFYENGFANPMSGLSAFSGGAIYSTGPLFIYNTTFEANHACRASSIYAADILEMYDSTIVDSISEYGLNMDLEAISGSSNSVFRLINNSFILTGKTPMEAANDTMTVNSRNQPIGVKLYNFYSRSVVALGIGTFKEAYIENCTFDGGNVSHEGSIAISSTNNWNPSLSGNVTVVNTTFRDMKAATVFYRAQSTGSSREFDNCLFDNIEFLYIVSTAPANSSIVINNSVILSDGNQMIGQNAVLQNTDISNNWWGSNNGTYDLATVRTISGSTTASWNIVPNVVTTENLTNYLILTLNATNKTGLVQDVTLAFKSFDGENVSDYEGSLYPRNFKMSAVNGTLEVEEGIIDNSIVSAFEGTEGQGYYIEATVDNQTVNLTVEDKLSIGNVTIFAEDISMTYGETQINVTVLEENGNPVSEGIITLELNDKTYTADIVNGTATFDIDVLPNGKYTLDYSFNLDKVYNPTSNSSNLIVVAYKTNITANADDIKVGEDAIITVTVDSDATGTITLNNETKEVKDGTAVFTISGLGEGNYTYEVTYSGDDKYTKETIEVEFEVSKVSDYEFKASAEDIKVGEDAVIEIALPNDAKGNVTVNGKSTKVDKGVAKIAISDLTEGNYNYTVIYSGDDKYTSNTTEVSFAVSKISEFDLNASAEDVDVGDKVVVEVTGIPADATGIITVTVNGKDYEALVSAGFVNIPNLPAGDYKADVLYSGDDKYVNKSTTVSFAVCKISEFDLNASAADVILDNDVIVVVTGIPSDATGTVTVTVNGKDYKGDVSKGSATITISGLNHGEYNADVVYSGDDKYTNKSTTVSFEVAKIVTNDTFEKFFDDEGNLRDEVQCDELVFEGVISNKNTDKININRSIKLLGENATLDNIAINVTADDVVIDGFTINAKDMEYAISVENASNVEIIDTALNVVGKIGETAYAIIADNADNLNIIGNNIVYEGNGNGTNVTNALRVSNSKGVVVSYNEFDITVPSSYVPWDEVPPGSGNWVSAPISEGIVFDNCDDLELSGNEINVDYNEVVGSYDTIYAVDIKNSDNVIVDSNVIVANGHSYIYGLIISGKNFTVSDNEITTESDSYYANGIDIEGPAAGIIKNNNIETNAPLSAYPVYSSMSNGNVEVEYINNNISGSAAVIYGMELGGQKETVTGNNIELEGNYTIGIASKAKELNVKDNTIVAPGSNVGSPDVWDSIPYETAGIKAIAGKVNVENNNITTTGNYSVTLTTNDNVNVVGNYLVANELTGDASVNYVSENATVKDNIPKMEKVNMDAGDIESVYGEDVKVNATVTDRDGNPVSDVPVTLTVGDKTYNTKTDKDGIAAFDLGKLPAGNYTLDYSINATGYTKESASANVSIAPAEADIAVDINKPVRGEDLVVNVTVPEDAKGNVTVSVDGKNYTAPVKDGKATVSVPNLKSGNYTVDVTYSGDDNYSPVSKSSNATVEKAIIISAPDVTKYFHGSERFVVTVTDNKGNVLANKSVVIYINGVSYTRTTDAKGTASIALGLNSGVYNVTSIVDDESVDSVVTILSTVNGTDVVKMYRNGTQYYATFLDSQGKYLADGTTVQFNINGVMYDRKVSGDKGLARLNINLPAGEYIITAMNPVTGEKAANKITVLATIVENRDLTKYYKNATQYTVKVLGADGKPVAAGETVTFNINGVMYKRTTDASGIAKININLAPSDYIITAEYNGFTVSNNIKVLPVLSAEDITMKYRDGTQFKATLVDGQGKPYAGQSVTFNINGVFYNRSTDSTGTAKLNINLMPGEYIITSSYNGANIANTVKISA